MSLEDRHYMTYLSCQDYCDYSSRVDYFHDYNFAELVKLTLQNCHHWYGKTSFDSHLQETSKCCLVNLSPKLFSLLLSSVLILIMDYKGLSFTVWDRIEDDEEIQDIQGKTESD